MSNKQIPAIRLGFYCSLSQLHLSRPLLRPCDHLNKLGDLLLFTGGEFFTGLTQGGDNFRLLWLWPGFLDGQYQTARHHPHINRCTRLKPRLSQFPLSVIVGSESRT